MRFQKPGLFFFAMLFVLLTAAGCAAYIVTLDYDSLVAGIVQAIHKNGLENKIRREVFTRRRFLLVQHCAWVVLVLLPIFFWLALRYQRAIQTGYRFVYWSLRECVLEAVAVYSNNTKRQNQSVLLLMLGAIFFFCYGMYTSYLTYDEMWSYNYYTVHPFYYSFFTYSSYPLFELTTHLFKWLPLPMKINLRLSPFIFGIAGSLLLYACLRRYARSHFLAMVGLAAFVVSPLTIVYMINARGVMHELFFAVAGFFAFLCWLRHPARKKYLVLYTVAGILGLYSMTTHVLFLFFLLLTGLLVLLPKNTAKALLFLRANLLTLVVFFILYASIFFTTGLSVYTDVVTATPTFRQLCLQFPHTMQVILGDYAGFSFVTGFLFLMAIFLLLLLRNRLPHGWRLPAIMAAVLPLLAVPFYFITGFDYAGRSLAFGSLSIPLMACSYVKMMEPWFNKNSRVKKMIGASAVPLALLLQGYFYFPVNAADRNVAALSHLFIAHNIQSCYDNTQQESGFFYYYPGIEYYYRQQQKNISFTLAAKNSMRFKAFSANDHYDCIVFDRTGTGKDQPAGYKLFYRDAARGFVIWLRNDLFKFTPSKP